MIGAHWPALLASLTDDEARGAVERRLERALASAGAVAWQWDVASWRSRLSAGRADLLSLKDDPGSGSLALVHPADRRWLREAVTRASLGEIPYDFEFRLLRPDGGVEWVRDRGRLEYDAAGEPLRLAGVAQLVTAQKRTEAAFAATFEQAAVGMAQVALDGTFLKVNDRLCGLLGRSRAGLLRLRFQDITHPDDLAASLAMLDDLTAGRIASYSMEKRYLRADGGIVWTKLTGSLVRDPTDAADYFISVFDDIGERRRNEEIIATTRAAAAALAESEAQLRLFVDQAPAAVAMFDADMRYLAASRRFARDYGLDPDNTAALVGRSHYDVFPDVLPEWREVHRRVLAGESMSAQEERWLRADGRTDWTRWEMKPWLRPDGAVGGALLFAELVTGRKEAEQRLADSEARLRLTQEGGRIGSWDWDLATGKVAWSAYKCLMFGVDPSRCADIDIEDWRRSIHPDDVAVVQERVRAVLDGGDAIDHDYRIVVDGATRWINGRGNVVRDAEGRAVRMVGIDIDVTERRRLEDELRRLTETLHARVQDEQRLVAERTAELRVANARLVNEMSRRERAQSALLQSQKLEALGQLTAGVAHDFNNAIAAIAGAFSLIERRTADPAILDVTRHGVKAAWRGGALVKQMLMFARQQTLAPRVVDLRDLLEEARPLLRRSVGPAVALTIDCPADLDPVLVDPVQLEAALINLAVNARDAMAEGGALTIAVLDSPRGTSGGAASRPAELGEADAVEIRVIDTGRGIPPDQLQRVIEPFFTTKGVGRGTGLGLAMVHGFMQASDGALRIRSQVGTGTAISLFLPQTTRPPDDLPAIVDGKGATARLHGDATILLIDDDDTVRSIVAAQLMDLGYRVVEAADGTEALDAIRRPPPVDLVLTDVRMPGLSGPDVAVAARREQPRLPILFMTAHADRTSLVGENVLEKPFTPEALAERVLDALGRKPAESVLEEAALDRLEARLRSAFLRPLLQQWRDSRKAGPIPRLADFDFDACVANNHLAIIDVDMQCLPITFRVAQVGPGLSGRTGTELADRDLPVTGSEALGSHEAAYRRCVRTRKPSYEYARFELGEAKPVLFERLLLPFASDGTSITHLVSLVVIDDTPASHLH